MKQRSDKNSFENNYINLDLKLKKNLSQKIEFNQINKNLSGIQSKKELFEHKSGFPNRKNYMTTTKYDLI